MTDQPRQPEQPQGDDQRRTYTEEFRVSGERVLAKVKELVHEGNVRRITIKNDEGRTLIEIPLTLGVIGTVLLPVWAAIGAIAALAANLTIAVDRVDGSQATAAGAAGTGQEASPTDPAATAQEDMARRARTATGPDAGVAGNTIGTTNQAQPPYSPPNENDV